MISQKLTHADREIIFIIVRIFMRLTAIKSLPKYIENHVYTDIPDSPAIEVKRISFKKMRDQHANTKVCKELDHLRLYLQEFVHQKGMMRREQLKGISEAGVVVVREIGDNYLIKYQDLYIDFDHYE